MERTIRVTGKGKLAVKPDLIELTLSIKDIKKEYDELLKRSSSATNEVKELLEKIGFERKDIKTKSFDINIEYDSYRDKNDKWVEEFKGYSFIHKMKIEFEASNKMLGRVLYSLSKSTFYPSFSISYTVSNPEKYKNKLLENAINNSKEKAIVLANASGVKLGNILSIDYSWSELRISSSPFENKKWFFEEDNDESDYVIDVEIDDIDVTDTVTVIWNIE
ncbi:SIMPL domain-containing protein [Faecalibacillus faecis]|uniref:SIMPL domain-containing protein n=1 Tax=Faecalibacillus faecis TaxID=1982628 RepID=UPI002F947855